MARQQTPMPESKETPANATAIAQEFDAVNQLAALTVDANEAAHALALQLGYDGALSMGALEDGIRFYQQRTAEACIELGKRLLLLKETCSHGDFKPRLELLGIEYTAAKRFMAVAAKFSKGATSHLLKVAASQGKVIELLVLDDEEVAELAENGTVRGMAADDIANMGVRQLRAALRESREEKSAVEKVLSDKNATNDKLRTQLKRIETLPTDEVLADLHKELAAHANEALGMVQGRVRMAFAMLAAHHASHGGNSLQVMAGYAGQLQQLLNELRDDFNLIDTAGNGTPEWQRWADAQDAAAAPAATGTAAEH